MADSYRVALLGHGIGPSLSPALHMQEAANLGLRYDYEVFDLIDEPSTDLGAWLTRLEGEGFAATNVTHPFKQAILEHVDERSPAVQDIGSANTVLLAGGRRIAHNTDYSGFRHALSEFLGPGGRGNVLQVGAGGAGLATALALLDLHFDRVIVHDVVPAAAEALVSRFRRSDAELTTTNGDVGTWLDQVDGVVHATPIGMKERPGVAFDVQRLKRGAWVAEIVYRPLDTELVRRARRRGLATLDGGAMAVGQALDSLELITGRTPDRTRMTEHFRSLVATPGPSSDSYAD